ncbi:MAG: AAA family ATPase, partial [Thermomicrobium sp.]|nr:AAA family ATPase [Thermomicrobium sp.]
MNGEASDLVTRLRVPVEQLRRRLDPSTLPFQTTAEVEPIVGTVGQPRALEALEFGLEVPTYGYNVYVAGRPGSGRESTVLRLVEQIAVSRPTPSDWVYVHNFQDPERPVAIALPAGRGTQLARDMDEFLRAAQQAIPRAFESEEYDRRRRAIVERLSEERERLWEGVRQFAQQLGFAVELTPAGVISVPVVQGRPLAPEEYERLPAPVREELERRNQRIQDQVADALREVRRLERETADRLRQLDREVALFAVGGLFEELRERYHDLPQVLQFLEQVREDIPEHLHDFFPPQLPGVPAPIAQLQALQQQEHLARYRVNVFVDNSQTKGAPVVFERNPSYYNLVGRIDYRATFGAMVTDFSQVRAGALHRANGGYLVLHAVELLSNPFAWEALKRALITGRVVIENLGQQYAVLPTATLRPDPIPLNVKVVLLGSPLLYYLLAAYDDDFRELFRVRADFAPDMEWNEQHVMGYAAFISRLVREQGLRHFDRSAVARVIEYGARQVEHQRKLSSQLLEIGNLVAEASYWAGKAGRDLVTAEDVETAIRKKQYRSNLLAERVRELIAEGTLKI